MCNRKNSGCIPETKQILIHGKISLGTKSAEQLIYIYPTKMELDDK